MLVTIINSVALTVERLIKLQTDHESGLNLTEKLTMYKVPTKLAKCMPFLLLNKDLEKI